MNYKFKEQAGRGLKVLGAGWLLLSSSLPACLPAHIANAIIGRRADRQAGAFALLLEQNRAEGQGKRAWSGSAQRAKGDGKKER